MTKKSTITLAVLGTIISASAQSDLLNLPISSYLDNIADSAAIQRNAPYVPLKIMGARDKDERFWTKKKVSVSYGYADTDYDRNGDASTHSVVPELYLESRSGFSLNFAGLYSNTDREYNRISKACSDSYGISVQPAQELWRHISPDDPATQLWLGLGLGYRRTDTDFMSLGFRDDAQSDSYFISPNLIFARKVTERLTAMVIPAYTMEWMSTDFSAGDVDSEAGLFTLTGRADYGVTDKVTLTGFATWKRDVHMDVDIPTVSNLDCHSWAEFGGNVRVAIAENMGLRAGYSYEAFHPDFSRHKFSARFELGF